jgi:hypothetical protein
MADELLTPLENKQIDALKAGASREEVATLSKQRVEEVPQMFDLLSPEQVTETTGLEFDPADVTENDNDSNTLRNLASSQILALNGTPTRELMNIVATDPNITARLHGEFANKVDRRRQELREALQTTFVDSPADIEDNVLAAVALDTELSEASTQVGAVEAEVIDSIAPPFDFNKEKEEIQKLKLMQANSMAEIWNTATWADITTDIAGVVLPFNFIFDSADLANSRELQRVLDEPVESLEQLILAYHSQPAERRAEIWPTLVEEIKIASGTDLFGKNITDQNSLKALAFLDLFMRPDGIEEAKFTQRLDAVLGAVDIVSFAPQAIATVLKVASTSVKRAHLAKLAKSTGNDELAAELTTASIVDEDVAIAANTTQHDAINNGMPYVSNPVLSPELMEGETLSGEVTNRLNGLARLNQQITTTFEEDAARLKIGIVNQPEREYHVQREIDKLIKESEDYFTDDGFYLENLHIVEETDGLTRIGYDIRDGVTGELHLSDTLEVKWGLDRVTGDFTETVEKGAGVGSQASRFLTSPSFWAQTASQGKKIASDFFDTFRSASVLEDLATSDKHTLNLMLQESVKSLRGPTKAKARKRVDDVLLQGDQHINEGTAVRGKTYSVRELREGIHLSGGGVVKLTSDDEIEAYYGARMVADTVFHIQNRTTRRQLDAINAKEIAGLGGEVGVGRVFETSSAARLSAATNNVRIWNRGTGEVINASSDILQDGYLKGQKLVRMLEPEKIPPGMKGSDGNEFVDYVLVHSDDINSLPDVVLHRKPGYIPKINQGVEFLLKENVGLGTKNGNEFKQAVTLRFFSNMGDAQKAKVDIIARETARINKAEDLTDAEKAREISALETRYQTLADREISAEQKLTESFGSSGGLYSGARSKHEIFYGLNDVQPERLGAFESLQRAVAHTGAYATRNEWRLGEQQRWVNTVRRELGGSVDITDFQGTKLGNSPREKALEAMRNQINLWSGMPTRQETAWKSIAQIGHDWALHGARGIGLTDKSSVKSLLWLKHADPFAAAKAAAFHTTLGLFNPVQLYVQGQAAVVAMARFPQEAPEAITYAIRMGFLDMMHNKQAFNANLLKLRKDAPLLEETHTQWLRSGLMQSVRTNADAVAMDAGMGNSAGAFKRVLETGLIPYRTGELFNRRTSFNISYLAWKKANPGKVPTDDQLVQIIGDAKMSMLELNRANAARFQGGPDANFIESVLGVMFQFAQVPMKTLELGIKGSARGGLKPGEKARVLASQAGLFGLVGLPMGQAVFSGIEELTGLRKETMDPETVAAWNGGVMQAIVSNYLGADVELASRAALANGIQSFLIDLMNGNDGIGWRAAGAFGTVGQRVTDLLDQAVWPVLGLAYDDEPITKEEWGVFAGNFGTLLAQVPSSSRNALVAHIMNDMNILYDKKGQVVAWKDFNPQTEFFTAIGFSPSERERVRNVQADNMDVGKVEQSYVDLYSAMLHRNIVMNKGDGPAKASFRLADKALSRLVPNEAMASRIKEKVLKRLTNPETIKDRELKTWYNRLYVDPATQLMIDISPRSTLRKLDAQTPIIQPLGQQEDLSVEGQQ